MKHQSKFDTFIDTVVRSLQYGIAVNSFNKNLSGALGNYFDFPKKVGYLDAARTDYQRARLAFKRHPNQEKDTKLLSNLRKKLDRAEFSCMIHTPANIVDKKPYKIGDLWRELLKVPLE